MPQQLPLLNLHQDFPPVTAAWGDEDPLPGLLCAGADLSVERLQAAYRLGIFPWYSDDQPILWWSPDPRMVLKVADFKRSHSFKKTLKKFQQSNNCAIYFDRAFESVIAHCAHASRQGQRGSWITPEVQTAYSALHRAGLAHSVETWINNELVGGLYCTAIGQAVFGESMFSLQTDASKIALSALVDFCAMNGISQIDCQQQTTHLHSLGARPIARHDFCLEVAQLCNQTSPLWPSYFEA